MKAIGQAITLAGSKATETAVTAIIGVKDLAEISTGRNTTGSGPKPGGPHLMQPTFNQSLKTNVMHYKTLK